MDEEEKKHCRVCGERVGVLYKRHGGRRCVVCLHRTHAEHLACNRKVCKKCSREEEIKAGESMPLPEKISFVHISDIHIGHKGSDELGSLLKSWLVNNKVDFACISGDLTRKAGRMDYIKAAGWIGEVESSGVRLAVVPGNHDIGYPGSARSVGRQVIGRKYQRWIQEIDRPLEPFIKGRGYMVLGLNSAHGLKISRFFNGYLDSGQRARALEIFKHAPEGFLKIIFCHHPLIRFASSAHKAMHGSAKTLGDLVDAGVDILMWGHQHSFVVSEIDSNDHKAFVVQGPTLSERTRNQNRPGFSFIEWHQGQKMVIRPVYIDGATKLVEGAKEAYPAAGPEHSG